MSKTTDLESQWDKQISYRVDISLTNLSQNIYVHANDKKTMAVTVHTIYRQVHWLIIEN